MPLSRIDTQRAFRLRRLDREKRILLWLQSFATFARRCSVKCMKTTNDTNGTRIAYSVDICRYFRWLGVSTSTMRQCDLHLCEADRMYLNPSLIVFVEPVGTNSLVAQKIAQEK